MFAPLYLLVLRIKIGPKVANEGFPPYFLISWTYSFSASFFLVSTWTVAHILYFNLMLICGQSEPLLFRFVPKAFCNSLQLPVVTTNTTFQAQLVHFPPPPKVGHFSKSSIKPPFLTTHTLQSLCFPWVHTGKWEGRKNRRKNRKRPMEGAGK